MELGKVTRAYLSRFDNVPVFIRGVSAHWYDLVAGATASGLVILIIASLFGLSHHWLFLVFVGAFFVGAYAAWRDEYVPYDLIIDISDVKLTTITTPQRDKTVSKTLEIWTEIAVRNAGKPTIVDGWTLTIPALLPDAPFLPNDISYPDGNCSLVAIPTGDIKHIWISFHFDGDVPDRIDKLRQPNCILHYQDVKQNTHSHEFTF